MSNDKSFPKQILQILISPYIGGVEVYTLELDKKLIHRSVKVFILSNLNPILNKLKSFKITVFHIYGKKVGGVKRAFLVILLQPIYFLYYFPLLIYFRFVKKIRNVHVQDIGEKFVLSPICKLLGFNVIWTEHGILTSWLKNKFLWKYFKFVSHFADTIVAVSDLTREDLINNLKIQPQKIQVIYNGVDLNIITETEAKESENIIATYIGRMSIDKKIEDFLAIIPQKSEVEFRFVGDGDLLADLKGKYQHNHNIKFYGFQSDKEKFLAETDIFVHPSLHPAEGMSLGALEAMGSGKPIVAFDTGGMKELVQSGVNGFLVPHGDYNEFIDRISELAGSYKLRLTMGKKSRKIVEEKFNLEKNVEEFLKL